MNFLTSDLNFLETLLKLIKDFAPQITVILASFLAISGNRKQSAREYLAKSRSDSLNKTKEYFGDFVSVIYQIWGHKVMGATYSISRDAIDRKNITMIKLETSFNPNNSQDKIIIDLLKMIETETMKLEGELLTDDVEFGTRNEMNSEIIDTEIKPLMETLKIEIQTYFNDEWEAIKKEIKFKK